MSKDWETAVRDERIRQDKKWGEQNHRDSTWLAILVEEVGEAAKAILEKDGDDLEKEIIQVAAVAVAWRESRMRAKDCGCGLCGKGEGVRG